MILDEEYPPDVRVEKEAASLIKAGHKLSILCYDRDNKPEFEVVDKVNVHRIAISKWMYKFKALALNFPFYFNFWRKAIADQIKKENYDLIHFHDLTLAKVCINTAKKFNLPVIGDYHENRPEIMKLYHHVNTFPGNILISPRKWENYQQKYSKYLDHLILITDEAKTYYQDEYGIDAERITVVPNFPDLETLHSYNIDEAVLEKYKDKFMIIYFGDTGSRRGTFTLLEAAEALDGKSDVCFVIIGDSREQAVLQRKLEEMKLNNVELTGFMPVGKAISYFKASKAGICPFLRNVHHDTTFANKLFQYMAFGKPVIVSDCTSQENVVGNSDCGVVFKAGDAHDLVRQINRIMDPGIYKKFAQNAIKAVENNYNYTFAENRLLNLYETIYDETRRD